VAQKEEFLRTAVDHLNDIRSGKRIKDDADIFGEGWTLTFRNLSATQKIYAKKIIDETLMWGQLGQLTLSSVTISPISNNQNSPFQLAGSSPPSTPSTSRHVEVVVPDASNNSAQNDKICF